MGGSTASHYSGANVPYTQVSDAFDAAASLVHVAFSLDALRPAATAAHLAHLLAARAPPARPPTPHARVEAVWPASPAGRRPLAAPLWAHGAAGLGHRALASRVAARRAAAVRESLRPAARRSGLGVGGDQGALASELATRMEQEAAAFARAVGAAAAGSSSISSGGSAGRGLSAWLQVDGPEPDWDILLTDAAADEDAAHFPRTGPGPRPGRAAAAAAAAAARFQTALAVRVGSLLTEVGGPVTSAPSEWGWCLGALPDALAGPPNRPVEIDPGAGSAGPVGPCPDRSLGGLGRWMQGARVWGRACGRVEAEAQLAPLVADLRRRLRSDTLAGPPAAGPPPPPGADIAEAAAATVRLLDAAAAAARGAARRDWAAAAACKAGRGAGLFAMWAARQPRLYPYSRSLRGLCLLHSDSLRVLAALAALLAVLPPPIPRRPASPAGGSRPGTPAAAAAAAGAAWGREGWESGWGVWAGRWRLEGARGALSGEVERLEARLLALFVEVRACRGPVSLCPCLQGYKWSNDIIYIYIYTPACRAACALRRSVLCSCPHAPVRMRLLLSCAVLKSGALVEVSLCAYHEEPRGGVPISSSRCPYIFVEVSLYLRRGVSISSSRCIYIFVEVSLYLRRGVFISSSRCLYAPISVS
jgi:hypothetical protein